MAYKVVYDKKALKQLSKLDPNQRKQILKWVDSNLVGTLNPWEHGKPLIGNLKDLWRYRVADYRLICRILDNELIIEVIEVGHRREIYE